MSSMLTFEMHSFNTSDSKVDVACDSNIQPDTEFIRVSECTGLENTLQSCKIENETMVDQNLFHLCNPCKNESVIIATIIAHGRIICNPGRYCIVSGLL